MMAETAQEEERQHEMEGKAMDMGMQLNCVKEFEQLDVLLSQIPLKAQSKFLMTCDLILTCIDADSSFIVLGSNVGLLFVFSREDSSIQRIKVTSMANMITNVKIHLGTDLLVAVATSTGYFSVYCFPGKASTLKKKTIQKFEVKDVHKYYITSLEWSTNGMKLYSGDTKGHVAVTEVDFLEDICKSSMLLIDSGTEIVQLSYDHKVLAVSTLLKSYIVRLDSNDQISYIGQEDRIMAGKFGACFVPGLCKTGDVLVYASRPECCLWISDIEGNVKNAQIFSSHLTSEAPKIEIHSLEKNTSQPLEKLQFGKLSVFRDRELVTWSSRALLILDPCTNKIVAYQSKFESIVDVVVVNGGEIFVLQRNSTARVIRIADKPDSKLGKAYHPSLSLEKPQPVISKKEDNGLENSRKAALNFLKNNLLNPLKKLDDHISNEFGRAKESYNIPDAKILEPEEEIQCSLEDVVDEKKEVKSEPPSQSQNLIENIKILNDDDNSFNEIIPANQAEGETSIVFSRKGKKHKKKHAKNGNHSPPIKEAKSENSKSETDINNSTSEILKRADSLLDRLKLNTEANNTHCQNEWIAEQTNGNQQDASETEGLTVAIEEHEKVMKIESAIAQIVTSDDDVNYGVLDSEVKQDDLNSSSEIALKNNESEETCDSSAASDGYLMSRTSDRLDECRADASWSSNIVGDSSNDSLNDCVERALKFVRSDSETKLIEHNLEIEEEAQNSHDTNKDSPVPNPSQNSIGGRKRKEIVESPTEDLYASSCTRSDSLDATSLDGNNSQFNFNEIYLIQSVVPKPNANVWAELNTPTNIFSVSSSDFYVWYTDKKENIYYMVQKDGKSPEWKEAPGRANQISVSPSGHFIRCLHKKVVYASTKAGFVHPKDLKFAEVVRDVDCISVDNNCAWYMTQAGSVIIETNLSIQQPISRPKKMKCPYTLKFIMCRYGVVWAITDRLQLLARKGVTAECPEGKEWALYSRDEPPFMFTNVSIGHDQVGWAVDILGQVWFCTGVTMENPFGCGKWWQVPLSESMVYDSGTIQMMQEVSHTFDPAKFALVISTSRGGLITAGTHGVLIALDFKNIFHVCEGYIQGFQWTNAVPSLLPSSSAWKLLCASVSNSKNGYVWAQNVSKVLYAFKRARGQTKIVEGRYEFTCMSANLTTVWALTTESRIMAREGIESSCPLGTKWKAIDLEQLVDVDIVHLSCSNMYVWAVDAEGAIHHRIGAHADRPDELSPIWLKLECFSDIIFTKIYAGPESWMVWAIDNRRLIYTRSGVRDNMPIGKEWVHVPGIQAMDITLTKSGVWALSTSGEIYYRQKVSKTNISGGHWKKIPGLFSKISASANDDLWGITMDGEMQQCNVQHIFEDLPSMSDIPTPTSPTGDLEWELI